MKYLGRNSSGGAGPTSPTARRIAIFVGNVPNGDSVSNSDYPDPGDGSGIAAALAFAAANPANKYLIWLAAGTYTLPSATPLLTVGANVHLVGCGQGITTIVGVAASGKSPQILSCAAGTKYSDFSLVSPTNVAGQSASAANGMVGLVGVGQQFRRVDLTINVSASIAHLTPRGFVYFAAASPGGTLFEDCQVTFVGDNATGMPSGGTCWFMTSSGSVTQAAAPVRFVNCTAKCDGGGSGSTTGVSGWLTDQFAQHINATGIKLDGVGIAANGTITGTSIGLYVDGFVFDARGIAASRQVYGVGCTVLGGTIRDTMIKGVRGIFDANANANSRVVYFRTTNATVRMNTRIEAQSYHPTAGSGGIELDAANTSTWDNTIVDAQLGTGDLTMLGIGVQSNTTFAAGIVCRNISIGAAAVNTRFATPPTYTAITDSSNAAFGVPELEVQVITSGTAATIRKNATAIYVDTTAGAFSLTWAAIAIGVKRLIQKTSTDLNAITMIRTGAETANGVAADFVLPNSILATQASWTTNDTAAAARWVSKNGV